MIYWPPPKTFPNGTWQLKGPAVTASTQLVIRVNSPLARCLPRRRVARVIRADDKRPRTFAFVEGGQIKVWLKYRGVGRTPSPYEIYADILNSLLSDEQGKHGDWSAYRLIPC